MVASILYAALVFAVLVIVHEAGHFAMAKKVGVRVLRYSIGYPPRIFGFRRGETEYSIGATPFGGYVRMLGDEVADELGPEDIRTFLTEVGRDLVESARTAAGKSVVEETNDMDSQLLALSRLPGIAESQRAASVEVFGRELK